jgi:hypothetical protein
MPCLSALRCVYLSQYVANLVTTDWILLIVIRFNMIVWCVIAPGSVIVMSVATAMMGLISIIMGVLLWRAYDKI